MREWLLEVRDLTTSFQTARGRFPALDHISFSLDRGECVGLVGESGSGKSVTALSLLQLVPSPPGFIESGEAWFEGLDILALDRKKVRSIRGNKISMIFQEPMTSLNPVFTIGDQIAEVYQIHQGCSKKDALDKARKMLEIVKIPAAAERLGEYPHQLSGGMRQRVMIAMALACRPKLLVADEPTTALDVTIQAQILNLIAQLQDQLQMSILLITHDLGVVAEVCSRVMVMYGGHIVEVADVRSLFAEPKHPYTSGLLRSIPKLGLKSDCLPTIPGHVPALGEFPPGCKFQDRCPLVRERCRKEQPILKEVGADHFSACWVVQGEA